MIGFIIEVMNSYFRVAKIALSHRINTALNQFHVNLILQNYTVEMNILQCDISNISFPAIDFLIIQIYKYFASFVV